MPSPTVTAARQQSAADKDIHVVPQAEAMSMLMKLFNTAGVRVLDLSPSQGSGRVHFELADGTSGLFLAFQGRDTFGSDEYATNLITQLSEACKGQFLTGKEGLPSTDGSVIRKVTSTCRSGANKGMIVSEITIIRRPNGFLMELTQITGGNPESNVKLDARLGWTDLVHAAMQFDGSR